MIAINNCHGKEQKTEIDLPFMDKNEIEAIKICLGLFDGPIKALEWGSGNSTLFFSSLLQPGSSWIALEHDAAWYKEMETKISRHPSSCASAILIPPGRSFDGLTDGDFDTFRDYVLTPARMGTTFDFILVDGRARTECLMMGWKLLNEDGAMVLHDAQRREYCAGIPKDCFSIRLTNPNVNVEGPITMLFMTKRHHLAKSLELKLRHHLENDGLLVTSDLAEIGNHGSWNGTCPTNNKNNIIPSNAPQACGKNDMARFTDADSSKINNSTELYEKILSNKNKIFDEIRSKRTLPPYESDNIATNTRRCLFLNTYYLAFIENHYQQHQELASESYAVQKQSLVGKCFGDSDFYSANLARAGWDTEDLIINCTPLQQAWARENNFHGEGFNVAIEQVRRARPDAVYIQDFGVCTKNFIDAIRPYTRLIIGQIASPVPPQTHVPGLDIIISSFPHFVDRFRKDGITSYYQPLAFEQRVLDKVPINNYEMRPIECSFVGGLSPHHSKGYGLLEFLAREVPIRFWGYGADRLPEDSAIRGRHHGEVWGEDMFRILSASKITINRHIDVAENNANNMRLFEATGCGALLITDYKDNLSDLFEIGKEVVAYRSPEECVALVRYYLAHPDRAAAIAKAGQEKTLREHSYGLRMQHTAEILERHLRYRLEKGTLQVPARISDGHQLISQAEVTQAMENAWKDPTIPLQQRALVQNQLEQMYQGREIVPFQSLASILAPFVRIGDSVLEIGCASGYYYEVLEYLLKKRISYTGVDYSEPMIKLAKDYYPAATFYTADGASLFFEDRRFHTVISSGVLLHVPNWRQHVLETVRVADTYIVVSRTPVCRSNPTRYMKKYAYGVETVELIFNEDEIIQEFLQHDLELISAIQLEGNPSGDEYSVTYLFRRPESRRRQCLGSISGLPDSSAEIREK